MKRVRSGRSKPPGSRRVNRRNLLLIPFAATAAAHACDVAPARATSGFGDLPSQAAGMPRGAPRLRDGEKLLKERHVEIFWSISRSVNDVAFCVRCRRCWARSRSEPSRARPIRGHHAGQRSGVPDRPQSQATECRSPHQHHPVPARWGRFGGSASLRGTRWACLDSLGGARLDARRIRRCREARCHRLAIFRNAWIELVRVEPAHLRARHDHLSSSRVKQRHRLITMLDLVRCVRESDATGDVSMSSAHLSCKCRPTMKRVDDGNARGGRGSSS